MNVTIGKKLKPLALLIHGVHGIGKTNFPTEAPAPIFIGSEENDEIECARLGKIETWEDQYLQEMDVTCIVTFKKREDLLLYMLTWPSELLLYD